MAEKKKDQKKTKRRLQRWGMQESQKTILVRAQKRYDQEAKVVLAYQEGQFMQLLMEIKTEIGIPDEIDVKFDPKNMSFVEVPPELKPSPTTQDLTKVKP